MSIQFGNPIVITSGTMNTLIDNGDNRKFKVKRVQWVNPSAASTSSLKITKYTSSSPYINMEVGVTTSGISQDMRIDQWWDNPFIDSMPTGTLYIFLW
jgi:hypothetical protein